MRPMTAREALEIEREEWLAKLRGDDGYSDIDVSQARRILDALVEWREEIMKDEGLTARLVAAELKLAPLERGEEPQA